MLRLLIILALSSLVSSLSAHEWKQVYIEYKIEEKQLVTTLEFDASYGVPELRDDENAKQPLREWLVARSLEQTKSIRIEAENYLNTLFLFQYQKNGERHRATSTYTFPDWETSPPSYPYSMDGCAYFTIKIFTPLPPEGDLILETPTGKYPKVTFSIPSNKGEDLYHIINPGEQYTFLSVTKDEQVEVHTTTYWQSLQNSFVNGFVHVIPEGLDHILFMVAICLLLTSGKSLFHQSLLFTAAHSITFGLASSGALMLTANQKPIIEIIIALSIAALAIENLFSKEVKVHRIILIFIFGLVHGLGFASSFGTQVVEKSSHFWSALISANVGIEVAQVMIIIAVFYALKTVKDSILKEHVCKFFSIAIALTALIMSAQRFPF